MLSPMCSNKTMRAACCGVLMILPFVRFAIGEVRLNFGAGHPHTVSVPLPHYHFIAGERLIYGVSYRGSARTDFRVLLAGENQAAGSSQPGPLGLAQSLKTTLQGQLLLTVVNVKGDHVVLAYRMRGARVQVIANGQEDGTDADTIKTDLSRDMFAALDLRGRVLSVRFDSATSKLSQGFARGLIAATQFVCPDKESEKLDQWETQEEDPNGRYAARYQRMNPRSGNVGSHARDSITFQKQITRYLPATANQSPTEFDVDARITPVGSLTVTFDRTNGRVTELGGTESQTIELAGKTVAHTQSTIVLNYVGDAALGSLRLAALRAANSHLESTVAALPLSASISKEESEASIERTELAADTLEKLLADLATLESGSGDQNETPIYLKFKALIYLHAESCASLGQMLATADAKSITMRVLVGALGAVGNQEAQAALVNAIKARSTDWPALSMLIPALNEAGAPTPLAEETINELARQSPNPDIASTAQLTMGAMAHNLNQTSPDRGRKIVDSLIKQIDSSSSADTTRLLLLALGNAGSARAYSTIARFTTDPSPSLRAAAASALRWVDSDQTDPQLIKVLISDAEPSVRLEAAIAFGFRKIDAKSFEAQKRALTIENDEKVRLALLRNLWKGRAAFPEARKLIEQAASSDTSEDIRKTAAGLLATDQTRAN